MPGSPQILTLPSFLERGVVSSSDQFGPVRTSSDRLDRLDRPVCVSGCCFLVGDTDLNWPAVFHNHGLFQSFSFV